MVQYVDVNVPFVNIENRLGFTALQVHDDPVCRDFIEAFPWCFEYDASRNVYLFIEPKTPRELN
jgi:hypothetical protein